MGQRCLTRGELIDLPFHRTAGRISLAIFALGLAGVLAFGAGQASASRVDCGDTIRADTTLHRDLVNCRKHGLVIAANDVTLDLNGHTIDGGDPYCRRDRRNREPRMRGGNDCGAGVLNEGHDDVSVKHGSVREFAFGVLVADARHNSVLDISASRNGIWGISLDHAARSTIRNNSLFRNGADGLAMFRSVHNQIRKNSLRRNREGGILAIAGEDNVLSRNRVSRGGGGIQIGVDPGTAVAYVVRKNQVRGSSGRCSGGAPQYCSGISVGPAAEGTLISHNHVVGSERDGINILNASTTLTGNRAVRNGKLGINAVLGVIDGGGNLASGNGDPLQCVNVTCH